MSAALEKPDSAFSVGVIVDFGFVSRVLVLMDAVLAGVLMSMHVRIANMVMLMRMLMKVLMRVGVRVLVQVPQFFVSMFVAVFLDGGVRMLVQVSVVSVSMLMAVFVGVLVGMQVPVFMFTFHGCFPPFLLLSLMSLKVTAGCQYGQGRRIPRYSR